MPDKLAQAFWGHNEQAAPGAIIGSGPLTRSRRNVIHSGFKQGNDMAEIKIKTDVAGRVCAIAAAVGATVGDGDEIVFVEAMKMEIPVNATAAGTIKTILVAIDEVVAEGAVVAVLES